MADFHIRSDFSLTGHQPQAVDAIAKGFQEGMHEQTLLGVTGSGKTFTMANVIQRLGKPTLVMSHNKTLAAQLYAELKEFFPDNAVEYFVSYYDYYQPESYVPSKDMYIEKDCDMRPPRHFLPDRMSSLFLLFHVSTVWVNLKNTVNSSFS